VIVVADTSSLNYLLRMGRVELLQTLYQEVIFPHAVRDEMLAVGAPLVVRTWAAQLPDWVNVMSVGRMDPSLPRRLGPGEREAISLALEISADVVLMDDQPARIAAENRGLLVSGTLSVLLQASRRSLIDFELAIAELKGLGFRISEAVETKMRGLSKKT